MAARVDVERVRALMARATGDEKHDESSTSTLDALWVLYDRVLRVDPSSPRAETRDRFILSKGHGPSAYYAVLAACGFFPVAWLRGFMQFRNALGAHPDVALHVRVAHTYQVAVISSCIDLHLRWAVMRGLQHRNIHETNGGDPHSAAASPRSLDAFRTRKSLAAESDPPIGDAGGSEGLDQALTLDLARVM